MSSTFVDLLSTIRQRLKPPILIALGGPTQAADLVAAQDHTTACYQMDLFQAERLRAELAETGLQADIHTAADLWDVPGPFGTVIYSAAARAERELKRDVVEQSYHVLRRDGLLMVFSGVPRDQFFPGLMKKTFGKSALETHDAGTVIWSVRGDDKPRRRHEVTYHVRRADAASVTVVSRPGVFSYGRFDDGARALSEVMEIQPGDHVLDIGSGTGAVGVLAGLRAGPGGAVTFVDSNLRGAVALAQLNAGAAGLTDIRAIAAVRLEGLSAAAFDVAVANPPYFGQMSITRLFVEGAYAALKLGGRLYLVTKQADLVEPILAESFGRSIMVLHRDYAVYAARKK